MFTAKAMGNNFASLFLSAIVAIFINYASSSSQAGEYISPSSAPYQLSLQSDGEHICGGALIDELHALTAARCFIQRGETGNVQVYDPEIDGELTVVAGIASLEDKAGDALRRKVALIVVPEGYSPDEFHVNDVAVVKLQSPISRANSPNVGYIHSPSTKESNAGKHAVVTGFQPRVEITDDGVYHFHASTTKLNRMTPLIIDNYACEKSYGSSVIRDSNLCTYAFAVGGQFYGSCMIDPGAPLVFNGTTIIGISSAGPTSCGGKLATVYTRVSAFLEFINAARRRHEARTFVISRPSDFN